MKHEVFEKNSILLLIGILVVVSIGGIVQVGSPGTELEFAL